MRRFRIVTLSAAAVALGILLAADNPSTEYHPTIAPASKEAEQAIAKFRAPAGLKIDLWAAEPLLANPVAFTFDEKGRCYVAETFRLHAGVTDIRGHLDWLDDDLACRTVADRLAMMRKHDGKNYDSYGVHHDRVRRLEDTTGSGKADKSTVFADGFKSPESGIGAGVLARGNKVWYTCIPDLWLLEDTKGTGKADVRKSLSTGYGLHVGFLGHDLHGLKLGPDGKLYFSIGDRALNVTAIDGRKAFNSDSGSVLRCKPDGTELELFATGLRNPQELAFDDYGNLFTCDNNSDSGDKVRWSYLVEGGDYGWRLGYQFMEQPYSRGPFNAEKLWYPPPDNTGTYIVPPIANIADGPSGLAHYPGTGLPDKYRGHFFLCDFRGGSSNSGVRSFTNKPKGAGFELVDSEQFCWGVLATDCEFGPDGGLYVSDWTEGWGKPNKGRIYRVHDPKLDNDATVREVKKLLAEGFEQRPIPELAKLLGHVDQRVRLEAQYALAAKGSAAVAALSEAATSGTNRLARLHAVWGLGQVGRQTPTALDPLVKLATDDDTEVRGQAIKLLGDHRVRAGVEAVRAGLRDAEPRVRFFAAAALGKLAPEGAGAALADLLRGNHDQDPFIRHAAVMGLTHLHDPKALTGLLHDPAPAVRVGVVVALRRLASPDVAAGLSDADPRVVLEAARAVNDVPIPEAMPKLAALIEKPKLPEPVARRVLNANFRLGRSENAAALARFAARADEPDLLRVEALKMLGDWPHPSGRDRVVGLWRPLEPRPASVAADAVRPVLAGLFHGSDAIRQEAAELVGQLAIKEAYGALFELFVDVGRPSRVRVQALKSLEAVRDETFSGVLRHALNDKSPDVRAAALGLIGHLDPVESLRLLEKALTNGTVTERQAAIASLARIQGNDADELLHWLLHRMMTGQLPAEVKLDVLEAASRRQSAMVKEKLAAVEKARPAGDDLAAYRECLVGGDVARGKKVFFEKTVAGCLKCHKVGDDGGEVGPNLSDVGKRQTREYILESIVLPNKQIAKGYETVVINTTKGTVVAGMVKAEDDKTLTLMTAEGTMVYLPKAQIEDRQTGPSAMPADEMQHLSKRELRDLVEFLANQKEPPRQN
jgi:quinoprotein glucose dehydrogenase